MRTISVKLPTEVAEHFDAALEATGQSASAYGRHAIEALLYGIENEGHGPDVVFPDEAWKLVSAAAEAAGMKGAEFVVSATLAAVADTRGEGASAELDAAHEEIAALKKLLAERGSEIATLKALAADKVRLHEPVTKVTPKAQARTAQAPKTVYRCKTKGCEYVVRGQLRSCPKHPQAGMRKEEW